MSDEKKGSLDLDFSEVGSKKRVISRPSLVKGTSTKKKAKVSRHENPIVFKLQDKDYVLTICEDDKEKQITLKTCTAKEFHTWYMQVWPSHNVVVKDFESIKSRGLAMRFVLKNNLQGYFRTKLAARLLN